MANEALKKWLKPLMTCKHGKTGEQIFGCTPCLETLREQEKYWSPESRAFYEKITRKD